MTIEQTIIEQLAKNREDIHLNHASSRPLSKGYEEIGIAGELALSRFTGFAPDLSLKPAGDNGIDHTIFLGFTVDVKTARKPFNLIHEQGKKFADIFILAKYDDDTKEATLLGWEWGLILKDAPVRDFGYGVINHYIPRDKLRTMDEIEHRLLTLDRKSDT